MKLPLEVKQNDFEGGNIRHVNITSSLPFVRNKRGVLIHRPRSARVYFNGMRSWLAVHNICGNQACGNDKLEFISSPLETEILCERCEVESLKIGLPSSSELVGRHVCIGGVKAKRSCCDK